MEKVVFVPNVPVQVALRYTDGKEVEGRFGNQMYYSLADGRGMYLDMNVAAKLNLLEPRKGEPFWIAKRWTGKKTDAPVWDVWAVGDQEALPAPRPVLVTADTTEAQLLQSLEEIKARQRANQAAAGASTPAPVAAAQVQPPTPDTRNGNSYGNGHSHAAIPTKIPYDVAFRELLGVVVEGLAAAHEQWSDAAKQDMVSTLIIQASRDGFLACWNRGAR